MFVLQNQYLGMIYLLCILIDFVIIGFLLHHIYLTGMGYTTNEILKWRDLKDAMKANDIIVLRQPWHGSRIFDLTETLQEEQETAIRESGGACESFKQIGNMYNNGWKSNLRRII